MKVILGSRHFGLFVCTAAALFAGCGGSGTPISPSTAGLTTERRHERPAYDVIYSFQGHPSDGEYPHGGLIRVKGRLYGTTYEGGANCSPSGGCGTVFSVTRSGTENVLHSFGGARDGDYPYAGLTIFDGTLFGTTYSGGPTATERYSRSRRPARKP